VAYGRGVASVSLSKSCEQCGERFHAHRKESSAQWTRRRFCCRSCARNWRAEHAPAPRASGRCERCGEFTTQLLEHLCKSCWDRRRYVRERVRILSNNRSWRDANPEYWRQPHIRARQRRWKDEHRTRVRAINRAARRRRRSRLAGGWVAEVRTTEEFISVLRQDPCCYCGGPSSDIDHVVAVSRGGGHVWDNLTSSCRRCNSQKHASDLLGFLLSSAQRPHTGQGEAPSRA
jgi:hypothetical protein